MNSAVALLAAIVLAVIGYQWYSKYIDINVIKVDPKRATPAKMYMDGVDFMPTGKHVLFGYQFKSIAALGPITGPIIAVQWGWLPALLWLVFGVLLLGWVQDYTSAMLTIRNEGQSFGALSYRLISPRARVTLMSFIYFYLVLIVAAFGAVVAGLLAQNPVVPVSIVALTILGMLAGYAIYRKRMDILMVTGVMVLLSLGGVWLGTKFRLPGSFDIWLLFTLFFCYLGAVLPIWSFAQPINYISFYLVFIGILGAAIGVFIGRPDFGTPAFVSWSAGPGLLWPMLFVTIACGAVSGWHSLVSSSGTGRQIENEADVRYVAAGSMFTEMVLGVLTTIMAAATLGNLDAYKKALAAGGPANVFAAGMSSLLGNLGVDKAFGVALAGAIYAIMAITVMQLVVRFQRVAGTELVGQRLPLMKNPHVGSLVALAIGWALVKTGTWSYLWTLFGGANQLMAALALLLASIWLVKENRASLWTFIPSLFMVVTTCAALLLTANTLVTNAGKLLSGAMKPPAGQSVSIAVGGSYVAAAIGVFLVIAAAVLFYDGIRVYARLRGQSKPAPAAFSQAD